MKRARINLTTSAAIDRCLIKLLVVGRRQRRRDFHPQVYHKRCSEGSCVLMVLLKDSLPPVGSMCSLVYVSN